MNKVLFAAAMVLGLAGCAGTPPAGTATASATAAHCTRTGLATGSHISDKNNCDSTGVGIVSASAFQDSMRGSVQGAGVGGK